MDRTTSLIIFGPIITVLTVTYAAVCVQYVMVEFSLWQLRREIKSMNKSINSSMERLKSHCNKQQKLIQQLNAEVTVYENLAARFAVPLGSDKTLDQVEALNNECLKHHRVIMEFKTRLKALQKETMAMVRELIVHSEIHAAKIRNIGARQRAIEAWRSVNSLYCLPFELLTAASI
jgi:chromosome segregation ATPase